MGIIPSMNATSQKILLIAIACYVGSCVTYYTAPETTKVGEFTLSHAPSSVWEDISTYLFIFAIGLTVAAIIMRRR